MSAFVIEHLEPRVWPWCILEYTHIARVVGRKNLLITNTKNKKLGMIAKTSAKSVTQLTIPNACILDPAAPKQLTPKEARTFDYFVFGGILGDYPPKQRTKKELGNVKGERRNLGKEQMSTDTAVLVVAEIVKGKHFKKMTFQDEITIPIRTGEEIILPYRYLVRNKKPVLPSGLLHYLRSKKGF